MEDKNESLLKLSDVKSYKIDFVNVKSIKSVVAILKAIDLTITWDKNFHPDRFKEIEDMGLLKEINR